MKQLLLGLLTVAMTSVASANPLLQKFNTPREVPPFDKIKPAHYMPAIDVAISENDKEIAAIVNQRSIPTFENTIEALEYSGTRLESIISIFYALNNAESSDEMMEIARALSPKLTAHGNKISSNKALFGRVKQVYDRKNVLNLNQEQMRLLQRTYDQFVDEGANLEGAQRAQYDSLSMRLSELTTLFGQNVLKATNSYTKLVTDQSMLAGMPETELGVAAALAKKKGKEGWMFDLSAPSYLGVVKYADNRDLRKELFMAYYTKCSNGGEYDNKKVAIDIANTRLAIAQLMGYDTYASYVLKKRMAKNADNVNQLLDKLYDAYSPIAREENATLNGFAIGATGKDFTIMPWDLSYYSNKLKEAKYAYNSEELRPYFELNNVIKGVFGLATELYGITFKENKKLPVYNEEVKGYEVFDKNGKFLAVLYTDFHPRAGKRPGAWMTSYRSQFVKDGKEVRPVVTIVMNFTRPTESRPALLSYLEVETFLHEFGHALHGIFANTTYKSMSGTSVYRDFVELPSQIMENWLGEKEFLDRFAVHYQTGEKLPESLIKKIADSENYMVATACLRQLYFSRLDLAFYNRTEPFTGDIMELDNSIRMKTVVTTEIPEAAMATQFSHIFAGGYAAGYYSYKWAEVLDADAFAAFKEKGIFNKEVAESFRENLLSKGGTEDPMQLYIRFRGAEPSIDAMLQRNGIKK